MKRLVFPSLFLSALVMASTANAAPPKKAQPAAAPAPAPAEVRPTAPSSPETEKLTPADADLERRALDTERAEREAAQKRFAETRAEQEKEASAEAERESKRQLVAAQQAARQKEEQDARDAQDRWSAAVVRRRIGLALTGGAVVTGAVALVFAYKTSQGVSSIESGTLGSGAEIDEAAKTAQTDKTIATGFGIAAGALALVGLPLLFSSMGNYATKSGRTSVPFHVAAGPAPGGGMAGITVRLP